MTSTIQRFDVVALVDHQRFHIFGGCRQHPNGHSPIGYGPDNSRGDDPDRFPGHNLFGVEHQPDQPPGQALDAPQSRYEHVRHAAFVYEVHVSPPGRGWHGSQCSGYYGISRNHSLVNDGIGALRQKTHAASSRRNLSGEALRNTLPLRSLSAFGETRSAVFPQGRDHKAERQHGSAAGCADQKASHVASRVRGKFMGQSVSVARESARNPAANFGREILKIEAVENVGKKLPGYSFGKLSRALWPQKTPASIEFYTGTPERTARHIAADKSDPGSALLVRILDSDQGWRALVWIMRDSRQPWWLELVRARECSLAYEQRREQLSLPL